MSKMAGAGVRSGDDLNVRIDVRQFAQAGQRLEGVAPLGAFERLSSEVRSHDSIRWVLEGSVDGEGACWLNLSVRAAVVVQCQRCLGDMSVEVDEDSRFRLLFAGEEWNDEDLEDDSFEAIEVEGPFDLASLVEDEVLLALPAVPLHERCELPAEHANVEAEPLAKRPSPFAVLEKLKRN